MMKEKNNECYYLLCITSKEEKGGLFVKKEKRGRDVGGYYLLAAQYRRLKTIFCAFQFSQMTQGSMCAQ